MVGEVKLSSETIVQTAWAKRKLLEIYYDDILDTMWKFNQTYSLASMEGKARVPHWYIMDKYGSSLTHSNNPNFKCSPFFYSALGRAYSLIWPIRDVKAGDMCTRNFIPQIMPNETMEICKVRLKAYSEKRINPQSIINDTKDAGGDNQEKLADLNIEMLSNKALPKVDQARRLCLGDYQSCLPENLIKLLHLALVEKVDSACVLNLVSLKQVSVKVGGEMLPCNELIANKDYLQNYIRLKCGGHEAYIPWFVSSYILPNSLIEFNKEYEKTDLPQFWIVKPCDKRQLELEMFVTSQFTRIARVCEVGSIAVSKCKKYLLCTLDNLYK